MFVLAGGHGACGMRGLPHAQAAACSRACRQPACRPRPRRRARPRVEAAGGCQLDASLLYEVVGDDVMPALLPINVMRNYALIQARRLRVRSVARLGAGGGC